MNNTFTYRKYYFGGIVGIVVLIFIARLFYLQIVDENLKKIALIQAFRHVPDYAARGNIFDRNGKRLVYNQAAFDLMVVPKDVRKFDTIELCKALNMDKETFVRRFLKAKRESPYRPYVFEKQLSVENSARLQERLYLFPGFYVQPRTLRKYPLSVAGHILGYVGEVSPEITDSSRYYRMGDYIGISGIERSYELDLRGRRGMKMIMVDVHNREKGSYRNGEMDTLAIAGNDLHTTLDLDLQVYAEQLMRNKIGSVVAIEPATGEILILASSPSYDPNLLVGSVRSQNYSVLEHDSLKPLYNRALMASYPPGSTFKIANALVGEQEGVLTPDTRYPCNFSVGSKRIKCHGHHPSPADLSQSIQYSCNPYYCRTFINIINKYPTAEEGFIKWRNHMISMGFGTKLKTDIPNELRGNVPSVAFYDRYHGKGRWKASSIYSLGIGQGEMGVTPLQMANYTALLANRGFYYTPHIIKSVEGGTINPRFKIKNRSTIDSIYFDPVVDAMTKVVEAGTGRGGKLKDILFCGKTGTAENPHGEDHSIFIAFAPRDNPKIALAVYVENAGFGAAYALPIASLLIEKYLTGTVTRPEMEKRMMGSVVLPRQKKLVPVKRKLSD